MMRIDPEVLIGARPTDGQRRKALRVAGCSRWGSQWRSVSAGDVPVRKPSHERHSRSRRRHIELAAVRSSRGPMESA